VRYRRADAISDIRLVLEPEIAARAAGQASPLQVRTLLDLTESMEVLVFTADAEAQWCSGYR
jgi:DNA-binding GntR family transcriptional regulator